MSKIKAPQPTNPEKIEDHIIAFLELIKILRLHSAWDRKQTHESIAPLIIEEVYEMIDAIHSKNDEEFSKELGDLLLHIFMHSYFAEERNAFTLKDVISQIHNKLIERLPSVFSDKQIDDEEELMQNWEQLKQKEGRKSVLDGIPNSIPALLKASRLQEKASRVGFDWENKDDVWEKVNEEFGEFKHELEHGDFEKREEEYGDFLFSLVNAARFEDINPETALIKANKKFTKRFQFIEKKAKEISKNLTEMTLEEMDEYWNMAKKDE